MRDDLISASKLSSDDKIATYETEMQKKLVDVPIG